MQKIFIKKGLFIFVLLSVIFIIMDSKIIGVANLEKSKLIKLNSNMIKDEMIAFYGTNYITRATALVDEQEKIPLNQNDKLVNKFTSKNWQPTMQKEYLPISCYIDLGTKFKITHIGFYDANDVATIEFSKGTPFHWVNFLTKKTNTYNTWQIVPVENVETQYIQLKIKDNCNSGIKELALYGYQTGGNPVIKTPINKKINFGTTADKAIGINAFIDDPLNVMKVSRNYKRIS